MMSINLLDIGPVNVAPDGGTRYVLLPGDDTSALTPDEQLAIEVHWSAEVSPGVTRADAWSSQIEIDQAL